MKKILIKIICSLAVLVATQSYAYTNHFIIDVINNSKDLNITLNNWTPDGSNSDYLQFPGDIHVAPHSTQTFQVMDPVGSNSHGVWQHYTFDVLVDQSQTVAATINGDIKPNNTDHWCGDIEYRYNAPCTLIQVNGKQRMVCVNTTEKNSKHYILTINSD